MTGILVQTTSVSGSRSGGGLSQGVRIRELLTDWSITPPRRLRDSPFTNKLCIVKS